MKSLKDVELSGKKVLVRCDLDVLDESGNIKEHYRLSSCLETLNHILSHQGFAYICGHTGKTQTPNEKFSTKKLLPFFNQNLINQNFEILENLRFDEREEKNDESLAQELASGKDIYVNESFATSHRNHASITTITKFLPSYFGFHFESEIKNLNLILQNPNRPLVIIIGGAKVDSKKPTIDKFLEISDHILIGGKLMFEEGISTNTKIIKGFDSNNGLDLGAESIEEFKKYIMEAKTIFWSGPMGKIEEDRYSVGTKKIVEFISKSEAFSVAGGGDTLSFLENNNLINKFNFVSVGGSSLLEYLSSQTLVGISALLNSDGQKNS